MASRGINKVILVGNLGNDPETRYMPSGGAVTNISIATSETWKDKQTGQPQERTEWHRVVFFNRLAEIAGEYLRKGSKVYVEGSLRTRKWQDQSGQDRYTTFSVAMRFRCKTAGVAPGATTKRPRATMVRRSRPPATIRGQRVPPLAVASRRTSVTSTTTFLSRPFHSGRYRTLLAGD